MAGKTQYGPHGLPLRRYGSFAGKEKEAEETHPVGKIIQFGPHGLPMRRYGSFAGKGAAGGAVFNLVTQYRDSRRR